MTMKFNIENIKKFLKLYYKKNENIDCDIKIETYIDCDRYAGEAEVEFNRTFKVKICDEEIKVTQDISKEEIKKIFAEILYEEGYKLLNAYFDANVKTRTYGIYEETDTKSVFNGLEIDVDKLEKQKQLIKE